VFWTLESTISPYNAQSVLNLESLYLCSVINYSRSVVWTSQSRNPPMSIKSWNPFLKFFNCKSFYHIKRFPHNLGWFSTWEQCVFWTLESTHNVFHTTCNGFWILESTHLCSVIRYPQCGLNAWTLESTIVHEELTIPQIARCVFWTPESTVLPHNAQWVLNSWNLPTCYAL